jgi:hypothetical protein
MRFTDGKPAVLSRVVEAGEVVFVTTAADPGPGDPGWTDWPIHPMYLPFVDVTVNHLLQRQTQTYNFKAGEVLTWRPPQRVTVPSFDVEYPDGRREPLEPARLEGGWPVLTVGDTVRAGVYFLKQTSGEDKGGAGVPLAVVPDPRESMNLESLNEQQLDERLGFAVRHRTAGESDLTGAERLNREYTPWLLLAVLFLAVGETLLAWYCGRAV